MTDEEINWISIILGKKYNSGKTIEHKIYKDWGSSIIFNTDHAIYSEAFSGSGESAIVSLIPKVIKAENYSLILLDEPEVSLHPGAQSRLVNFLLEQIKVKKHQIVISTHSPNIISNLPAEAIKVFSQNHSNGKFYIKENVLPTEAFYFLEHQVDKKMIIVEDILAKMIIESVLKDLGDETSSLFEIKFFPGGASRLKDEFIRIHSEEEDNIFVIFDGDQKKVPSHFNYRDLSAHELTTSKLQEKIKEQTGEEIQFLIDGNPNLGGRKDQEIELQKKYIDFYMNNVFYLPKSEPEQIIWNRDYALYLLETEDLSEIDDHEKYKEKFFLFSKLFYEDDISINSVYNIFIKKWKSDPDSAYDAIKETITEIKNKCK